MKTYLAWCLSLVALVSLAQSAPRAQSAPDRPKLAAQPSADDYRVGIDDVLVVSVLQAPELNTSARVSQLGTISLPLIGEIPVAGLSSHEIAAAVATKLREKYIREPEVSVQVTDTQSHGVSVIGAVKKPGVVQIRGTKTLLEVLSLAEGVTDDVGEDIVVVHAPDQNHTGDRASTTIKVKSLYEAGDAAANIAIEPGTVIKVQQAAMVYVVGEVKKPGAFPVRGGDRLTVLRALALGEGLAPTASKDAAVILRAGASGGRTEVPVRLSQIFKSKQPDIVLEPNDVLFVPVNGGKAVARGALDALTRILAFRPVL